MNSGGNIFQRLVRASALQAMGWGGSTAASRWVGATVTGAPTTGTHEVGDWITQQAGGACVCVTAGTPGVWKCVFDGFMDISASAMTFGATFTASTGFVFDYADALNYKEITFAELAGSISCYTNGVKTFYAGPAELFMTQGAPQRITYNRLTGDFLRYRDNGSFTTSYNFPATALTAGQVPRVGIRTANGGTDGTVSGFSTKAGFSDSFVRADSATLGSPWVNFEAGMRITSNKAVPTSSPASALVYYTSSGL